jgi:hypothetical protein
MRAHIIHLGFKQCPKRPKISTLKKGYNSRTNSNKKETYVHKCILQASLLLRYKLNPSLFGFIILRVMGLTAWDEGCDNRIVKSLLSVLSFLKVSNTHAQSSKSYLS